MFGFLQRCSMKITPINIQVDVVHSDEVFALQGVIDALKDYDHPEESDLATLGFLEKELMKNGEKYLRQGLVDRLVLKQVKDDEVVVEMKGDHDYQLNSLLDRYADYFLRVLYSQYFNPERKPEHFPSVTYQIYAELFANSD